jgi:hypothetical protein
MKNLIIKAANLIGFLFVVIGVLSFANLFSGVQIGTGETFAPDNAAAGVLFICLGLILFGLSTIARNILRKRF